MFIQEMQVRLQSTKDYLLMAMRCTARRTKKMLAKHRC